MNYLIPYYYLAKVPRIPEHGTNFTAEELYDHFKKQATTYEIESFTRSWFDKKFRDISIMQEQNDLLKSKAKEISRLGQRLFDLKVKQ